MEGEKGKLGGIEITTFKIKDCSFTAFIKANVTIDEWLKKQPGFQSRRIAQKKDGTVSWNMYPVHHTIEQQ